MSDHQDGPFGPWNPGIRSQLPSALWPLMTIFRPENAQVSADQARELAGFTGLSPFELATFKPERLVLHEVLIRITADFSVPDGPEYADLGISFRDIATTILSRHLESHSESIRQAYDALRDTAARLIDDELSRSFFNDDESAPKRPFWSRVFRGGGGRPAAPTDKIGLALARWRRLAARTDDPLQQAACAALRRIVTAIGGRHGAIRGDRSLVTELAVNQVCNTHGSAMIGGLIAPLIRDACARESYRLLPRQSRPVVMNIKGASASGKSTMRPLQRQLAEELGIDWRDFAVISPDIWRKFLLDYDTLGDAYKYAGTLTGHEVAIIDQKLDRYMADKADKDAMSHLLIDRFRFDSFAAEPDAEEGSNLLTRFGDDVYMFFMITPPEDTVARAWLRGLEFGRYKAVDDLLDHNVEAYTGMPRLFFTWALRPDKTVHYEFLDNSVEKGQRPRTVAFGQDGEITILRVKPLLDINRYQKINIDATTPADLYPESALLDAANNTSFLEQCGRQLTAVNFADFNSGVPYARMEHGKLVWTDPAGYDAALEDDETRAGLAALTGLVNGAPTDLPARSPPASAAGARTLGRWGPA